MKVRSKQILEAITKLLASPELISGTIQREDFYYFMTHEDTLWSIGEVNNNIELHLENCDQPSLFVKNLELKSITGDYFIFSSNDYSTKLFHDLLETVQAKVNGLDQTLNQLNYL